MSDGKSHLQERETVFTLSIDREDPRPRDTSVAVRRYLVPLFLSVVGAQRSHRRQWSAGTGRRTHVRAAVDGQTGDWAAHFRLVDAVQRVQLSGATPVRHHEDDHRDDDRGADRRARGDRDLIHV